MTRKKEGASRAPFFTIVFYSRRLRFESEQSGASEHRANGEFGRIEPLISFQSNIRCYARFGRRKESKEITDDGATDKNADRSTVTNFNLLLR